MKRLILALVAAVASLILCGEGRGQGLPSLAKAPEITVGRLPDGVSYYLVKNDDAPGLADFALVQGRRPDRNGPRRDLVSLPHFQGRKPYEFLAGSGVRYGERGFIQHLRDATVFRFANVPVFNSDVSDSTLLMMFDIVRSSPYGQALIISGNIDVAAISERIRILSMTVSQREDAGFSDDYSWRPQAEASVTTGTAPVGTIIIHYRSPRTDRELMNTIQPVMSKLLATELGVILEHRLRAAFASASVPLADYRYRYTGSDETAGDEMFSISIHTAPEHLEKALSTAGGVLSTLDAEGPTTEELSFARSVIAEGVARDVAGSRLTNSQYVDKCVAAYLYGANLASTAAISAVYTGRKLDLERERELLSRYVSATLSPRRNLHLHVRNPVKLSESRALDLFLKGWEGGIPALGATPLPEDTLKLATSRKKVKIKTNTTDPFSGGKIWTFSNGISVVFKKAPTGGTFHYGLMMKGGWTEIPGIKGSEAAFVGDDETKNLLATAERMLQSSRTELTRCISDLKCDTLEEPDFDTAIRKNLEMLALPAAIHVRFNVPRARVSDSTAHAILCIVRELASNAVRHGKATSVKVAGSIDNSHLSFSVRDDGTGFDVASRRSVSEGHFGLAGIQDRVNRLDGSFDIRSAPGKGTVARVSMPLPSNKQQLQSLSPNA